MNRSETMSRLDSIKDMSDQEISMNPTWIREVAQHAYHHMQMLRKVNNDNHKQLRSAKTKQR